MNIELCRDLSLREHGSRLTVVRDADGSWYVMDGVTPVVDAESGSWNHDGAATETSVTEAPPWLVAALEPQAPEDWRMCRFEIKSIGLSSPSAASRDDTVVLDAMKLALRTERDARERLEAELQGLKKSKTGVKPIIEREVGDGKEDSGSEAEQPHEPARGNRVQRGTRSKAPGVSADSVGEAPVP